MSLPIAAGYPSNAARTDAEMQATWEQVVSLLKEVPGGSGATPVTLSVANSFNCANNVCSYIVSANVGVSDALETIVPGAAARDGMILLIYPATGHLIQVNHNIGSTGKILTKDATSFTLSAQDQCLVVRYDSGAQVWREVVRDLTWVVRQCAGAYLPQTAAIVSNAATVNQFHVNINAGTLNTLNSSSIDPPQSMVLIGCLSGTLTINHNTGGGSNKILTTDSAACVINSADKYLLVRRDGSNWREVTRFGFPVAAPSTALTVTSRSTSFTAGYDSMEVVSTSGGNVVATIPTAVGNAGRVIWLVKTTAANSLTATRSLSQTLGGAVSIVLTDQNATLGLISDGTNWQVIPQQWKTGIPFGGEGTRQLPTSGTITSGSYFHLGNWTSTGNIVFQPGCRVFVAGTFTLTASHTITVNNGQAGGTGQNGTAGPSPQAGGGLAGGSANIGRFGGGGGGNGGDGGAGGSDTSGKQVPGGKAIGIDLGLLPSSGGGGGVNNASAVGGSGGNAGGTLYLEVLGNVVLNNNVTANGGNGIASVGSNSGGGGGGSGGSIEIRCRGTFLLASTKSISANGGNGGAGSGTGGTDGGGGGGGGGGHIRIWSEGGITMSGSLSVSGGSAGVGSSSQPASAGSTGVAEQLTGVGVSTRNG